MARYIPDLAALLRCCEHNYLRLLPLLRPLRAVGDTRRWSLDEQTDVELTIMELTRYTALVSLRQLRLNEEGYLLPRMDVRLYHDARVAEVLSSQQIGRLLPRYDYPNPKMHQRDEKFRVNHFLGEWLSLSQRIGFQRH